MCQQCQDNFSHLNIEVELHRGEDNDVKADQIAQTVIEKVLPQALRYDIPLIVIAYPSRVSLVANFFDIDIGIQINWFDQEYQTWIGREYNEHDNNTIDNMLGEWSTLVLDYLEEMERL